MKMIHCGAISSTAERSNIAKASGSITPVHDLNVPYEGPTEEYETPTAEMLFPPVSTLFWLRWIFSLGLGLIDFFNQFMHFGPRPPCKLPFQLHYQEQLIITSPPAPRIMHLLLSLKSETVLILKLEGPVRIWYGNLLMTELSRIFYCVRI